MPLYTDKCTFHQMRKQRVAGFSSCVFCLFVCCFCFVDFWVVVVVDLCLLLFSFTHMNE